MSFGRNAPGIQGGESQSFHGFLQFRLAAVRLRRTKAQAGGKFCLFQFTSAAGLFIGDNGTNAWQHDSL